MGGQEADYGTVWRCYGTVGDVVSFLTSGEEFASGIKPKLLTVLQDPTSSRLLQLELAATVDAREPFVKATYCLKGDGPLALEC